ncbi:hypothetical protein BABINDRAFT_162571 [Babjeviella inositovora NRRL Y-12698]|uniref:Peptide:N-glycanase 1 n=1 Tax=Babjeviella inositovora NRRL Y-12698 TaxID=984486 RepID=A0A1E3QPK4_9ASCO|nr:uncharacterized protein BABINDRAFT_162571 [Babjeviella inositovora NRRL Y-12698]ODQ78907.1 hypothetical protein BABINDRAFT_162571 [Babjeviella inositovora NRRL Y-12698]
MREYQVLALELAPVLRQAPPFIAQVHRLLGIVEVYSRDDLKAGALEFIPMERILKNALELEKASTASLGHQDYVVKALLAWFKNDFFQWVNKPECLLCHNTDQAKITSLGATKSSEEEHRRAQATTTEIYKCQQCHSTYRYPRNNDPLVVLEQHNGRCGEWCNGFMALLHAMEIPARYIWNAEDHVWCEYYSASQKRWIHLDSCENAFDEPLLYARGWGKKMSFVFAVSETLIVDVSAKYIDPEHQIPKQSKCDVRLLGKCVRMFNAGKWLAYNAKLTDLFLDYEEARLDEFYTKVLRPHYEEVAQLKGPSVATKTEELKPRETGAGEWTELRGESGK